MYLAIIGCVTMKLFKILIQKVSNKVSDVDYKDEARKHPTDFTRNRKMIFAELIIFKIGRASCRERV